jgi:hypothetical protein
VDSRCAHPTVRGAVRKAVCAREEKYVGRTRTGIGGPYSSSRGGPAVKGIHWVIPGVWPSRFPRSAAGPLGKATVNKEGMNAVKTLTVA